MKNQQGPDKDMHQGTWKSYVLKQQRNRRTFTSQYIQGKDGQKNERSENNLMKNNYKIQEYLAWRRENRFGKGGVWGKRGFYLQGRQLRAGRCHIGQKYDFLWRGLTDMNPQSFKAKG